jgi:DNA-binding SARP family transcriptional activator/Tfp pilus assembly protein PilF
MEGDSGMVEFRFLGGAMLQDAGQPLSGPAARRHPVALLALLATAPSRTLSRAKIIGLLWPDADEATGRNRLTSTLYSVRQAVGAGALTSVGDGLRLEQGEVACDVWRFLDALQAGDRAAAAREYGGPFLDGFYLEGSSLFDERVEAERQRLHRAWHDAVEALAEAADAGSRPREAGHWWQALCSADPLDSGVAARLVRSLAAAGSRREALRAAEGHVRSLREELGTEPDAGFMKLVAQLRSSPQVLHQGPPVAPTDEGPAIAVLPFETLGAGETALGEGVHSDLLARLSALGGLTVIARTSVRRYLHTDKSASEIGAELGVQWVLEGDVRTSGQRFRVNVRLIEAPSDRQVWAQDRDGLLSAGTFFEVQADIAAEIAERLHVQLTPTERLRLASKPTQNLEAYRLCTEGRMHLDGRSPEDMQQALCSFEAALALDPEYAVAWVGVADALGLLHAYGYAGPEVLPRAEQAIHTALERDPRCAEAHAALGRLMGQRNLAPEAEREMRLALSLRPGYAEAHNWLSVGLYITGDAAEAARSARRAVALNPLSPEAVSNLASSCLFSGQLEQALKSARRARELEADYTTATFFEALTLYEMGRFSEAAALLEGLFLPWAGSGPNTARALSLAAEGEEGQARALLAPIREAGHPFDEGLVLAALGEREAAFEAFGRASFDGLEFAVSYWPTVAVRYLFGRIWERLRDDPRYDELRWRIDESWGLVEPATADEASRRWTASRDPSTGRGR